MADQTLKPCPWCVRQQVIVDVAASGCFVRCRLCGARGPLVYEDSDAVELWNKRAKGAEVSTLEERISVLSSRMNEARARIARGDYAAASDTLAPLNL